MDPLNPSIFAAIRESVSAGISDDEIPLLRLVDSFEIAVLKCLWVDFLDVPFFKELAKIVIDGAAFKVSSVKFCVSEYDSRGEGMSICKHIEDPFYPVLFTHTIAIAGGSHISSELDSFARLRASMLSSTCVCSLPCKTISNAAPTSETWLSESGSARPRESAPSVYGARPTLSGGRWSTTMDPTFRPLKNSCGLQGPLTYSLRTNYRGAEVAA